MRRGFTTGSCAAAAAKAAAIALVTGEPPSRVQIATPSGVLFDASILTLERRPDSVKCGVVKDGGDDPDVTTGAIVCAEVSCLDEPQTRVSLDGGEGVGRVTKPGLDQPVGAAAINSTPRAMIEREIRDVMTRYGYRGALKVVISIPGGEELARRTFNPRFGVEGGLSILGTTGLVEPMSVPALLETIRLELRQRRALGETRVVVAPGNFGLAFVKSRFGYDPERAVKCSNFIGDTLDMAAEQGMTELLLCGRLGKLIKTSGGIMNTHSREGDCRMELMAATAIRVGASLECARRILDCVSTEAAFDVVCEEGLADPFMTETTARIDFHLKRRVAGRMNVECLVVTQSRGLIGATPGAETMMQTILEAER